MKASISINGNFFFFFIDILIQFFHILKLKKFVKFTKTWIFNVIHHIFLCEDSKQ